MSKQTTLVNDLYSRFIEKVEGMFHNDLWQIVVNESLRTDTKNSAFVYIDMGEHPVGIATKDVNGFIPCNFWFKDEVPRDEKKRIIDELNKEIFGLEPVEAYEIVASSMR